jgi:serine/threonine-protein kinase
VIHRDIKPENILLSGEHSVVADFGLARALDVAGGEKLTETGLALGTPHYMSPEQAAADGQLDGRSDLYSLGCVLYEMLAGQPPFTGATAQAVLARHSVDPVPSLRTVRATVPEAVEQAVEKALAKVPADRVATAAEFAEALMAEPKAGRPVRASSMPRPQKLLLGVAVGCVAVGVGVMVLQRSTPHAVAPSASKIAVLPFLPPGSDTGLATLGRDLATTISASLDGVGGIETADRLSIAASTPGTRSLSPAEGAALARSLGASSLVRGSLVRAGDQVRLDLGLYGAGDLEPLADGITVTAHHDSIAMLTDSACWRLLRQVWQRGEPPSPSLEAVTTRSLPALRAFLEGERELGANRWEEATRAFRSAITADSAFWLAHYRYALSSFWAGAPIELDLKPLRLNLHVLPERERLLIAPMIDSMPLGERFERFRTVTQRFPNYWPGWFLYADILFHIGPILGHDWTEALEAFQRVVVLNSRLIPAWEHLFIMTNVRDRAEASRSLARLSELGWKEGEDQFFRLQMGIIRAGGVIPPDLYNLADSLAKFMASSPSSYLAKYGHSDLNLLQAGFPVAQLDFNGRVLRFGTRLKTTLRASDAWSWAARGRWDSAVTLMAAVARERPGVIGPLRLSPPQFPPIGGPALAIENYGIAVIGAWLGATPPPLAAQRRSAALAAIDGLGDEESKRDARARVAWLDGILGYTQRSRQAIQAARRDANRSGYYQTAVVDRSLEAFDRALAGDRSGAGRELAELEERCLNATHMYSFLPETHSCNWFTPHIAIERLAAAQWLQEAGQVEQGVRLLRYQDAGTWSGWSWTLNNALAAPTALARARLEEAQGEHAIAREHYRLFLQRFDAPVPSLVHLVEQGRAGLARLEKDH